MGDRLYFYYSGFSGISPKLGGDIYAGGATGVAFLRRDGFASMDAKDKSGTLTTRLITFKGREILRRTKDMAEAKMLRGIYGDTDSVMINTNTDNIQDAIKVGNEFKKDVNDSYKLLEIDIDNIFRRLLLHAKKKYAAINMVQIDGKYTEKLEVKGLDMRRREYCALSKETSSYVPFCMC